MKKIILYPLALAAAAVFLFCGSCSFADAKADPLPAVELNAQDRILILAPHPDDEVLGCGGIMQKAAAMRLPMRIVFLTYGDNNPWSFLVYRKHPVIMPKAVRKMGLIRHDEAVAADSILGVPESQLTFLGYPDFRTLDIWNAHWGSRPAMESILSRVNKVSYDNAFRPGALYKGEEIVQDLMAIIDEFEPTKIFLSNPADRNPDHQSLYLFTKVALWGLVNVTNAREYSYLIHDSKWPMPRGYNPDDLMSPPQDLAGDMSWQEETLTPAEVAKKHDAIKKHKSQFKASGAYLLSFIRKNEIFGDFPVVLLGAGDTDLVGKSSVKEIDDIPEDLTDYQRASFINIRSCNIRLEKDSVIMTIKLSKVLVDPTKLSLRVYGYRRDRDFRDMPKIHIMVEAEDYRVMDQNRPVPRYIASVKRKPKDIEISIPLRCLGEPEKFFISASTHAGAVKMRDIPWRIAELNIPEQDRQ